MKIKLTNGCSCSKPQVHPLTWERSNASIKKPWYIHYRFYDPLFLDKYPNGYPKQIKGMNSFRTLHERQDATRELLAAELKLLEQQAYNPITETLTETQEILSDYPINPDTGLIEALKKALARLDIVKEFRDDIISNFRFIEPAAQQLRFDKKPIKEIKRRHIILILDQCGKNKDTWTPSTYNRYRRNLSCVFSELVKVEAMEHNPVDRYLGQKKGTKKIKEILTREEIKIINEKLRPLNYLFWRFIHIFCNSGARTPEIMKVKKSDIDLARQMVKYTIKKGEFIREVERPIKNDVLYLWEQLLVEAKDMPADCYIFSAGLNPGINPIRKDQIKRRWRLWVQTKLKIKKTVYALKYLNTDKMDELYGSSVAAQLNAHDEAMVNNHYAVNQQARRNEIIKQAANPLTI